jgi:hypothetical protein
MKTKILPALAILLIIASSTNAQITQGKYLLGGSLGYSNNQDVQYNGSPAQKFFSSNIQIGKVLKENKVAGLILSYRFADNGLATYKLDQYGAGVFYRKYKPLTKVLYFFGEADAVYDYSRNIQGKFEIGSDGNRYTTNGARLSFVPGLSYAVSGKLQMELSMPNLLNLSYDRVKDERTSAGFQQIATSKANNFDAKASLNASLLNNFAIGFKFLLGK